MKYGGTLRTMINITNEISISEEELKFKFVRSSGPGGQNVNKVSTAVQLRFDVVGSPTLPPDIRSRLIALAGNRVTEKGVLVIDTQQYSAQSQNRQAAIDRLVDLIKQAAIPPKVRRKTKPSDGAKQRRLESKRRRGKVKQLRKPVNDFE
jgi:ribosome-associated protein